MVLEKRKDYLDELDFTESGNWNSARIYSEAMITKLLIEAGDFERIAKFGCSDFNEILFLDKKLRIQRRLDAIDWLLNTLKTIIDNSYFALKVKDKEGVMKLHKTLEDIESLLDKIKIVNQDRGDIKTEINEKKFALLLSHLTRIRRELSIALNNADLIFTHREEFDPQKFKEMVKDRLANVG